MENSHALKYAGFWIRFWATIIDTVLLTLITWPLLLWIYGAEIVDTERAIAGPADLLAGLLPHGPAELLISYVLPVVALIVFWRYRSATPGKMLLGLHIVDAQTGGGLSLGQSIVRFFAYVASTIPFGLGFLWIAFDPRKQAWHDKLAGTVVIRDGGQPSPYSSLIVH
jgi:uncharacterized RDD family membrane protein YckC